MKTFTRTIGLLALTCVMAIGGWAQSALRSSTLSNNITDTQTTFDVVSGTNVTAGMLAYVDAEAMRITAVSTNTLTVIRGQEGTVAEDHNSTSTIWMDSPQYFTATPFGPAGRCDGTTEPLLQRTPVIHTPTGDEYRCTNNQWARTAYIRAIRSNSDSHPVTLNSRDFRRTTGDSIGFQSFANQSVTSTGTVFGGQVRARLADDIDMGNLIGLQSDVFLAGTTAKTVSGDIRGLQIELTTSDSATNTVSGDVTGIRIRAAFSASTLTGDMVPIKIEVAETQTNSQQWDAVFELEGANTGIWASGAASGVGDTEDGYFKIIIDGVAQYVMTFSDTP